MPSSKDDPLAGATHYDATSGRTLWLEGTTNLAARKAYFERYKELEPSADEAQWNTAWAAAIGAYGFVMEGRTRPK